MPLVTDVAELRALLARTRTIAVLGAHPAPERPAFYVPDYLHRMGYRIFPVNATRTGTRLWGEPVRARLTDIPVPVDLVDVFRRSEAVPDHLADMLALAPRPDAVWMQAGISNESVAAALVAVGIAVVQDRCTYADHRAFGIGPKE